MQRARYIFDKTVLLENAGEVAAVCAILWLQSRAYHMTGPDEVVIIGRVDLLAMLCSLSAFILGCVSLIILRVLKKQEAEDLSSRKMWAYLSLLASIVLILFSIMPVRMG